MPRKSAPLQINEFTGGLNVEFNPLSVPPNTTLDEQNMEIQRDGSRLKRLGFAFEEGFVEVDSTVPVEDGRQLATQLYRWENAGGREEKTLFVAQVGYNLSVFDPDGAEGISATRIYSENYNPQIYSELVDITVIDGILVLVNGEKDVNIYEYNEDSNTISKSTDTLLVRDLFGISVTLDGEEITSKTNLNIRPLSTSNSHTYNLRNQTFAYPRKSGNTENVIDPIFSFNQSSGRFPSNADNLNTHFYADPNDTDDRLSERYFSNIMNINPPGIERAPQGFFVIDALERGASRLEEITKLQDTYPTQLFYRPTSLPEDRTPGGASVISQFAGRVWYGGFSGKVINGDDRSPRMSSYILFSSIVDDFTDLTQCYQKADPTSNVDSAIVDTDGGFIRLDGAYGVNKMIPIGNSLFILAQNGVWRVTGSEDGQFSGTSYQAERITDKGCFSKTSVVQISKSFIYWGRDSIYLISQDEFGVWREQDISSSSIQNFYLNITSAQKQRVSSHYDSFEKKVRWVYTKTPGEAEYSEELILNTEYNSYTYNRIPIKENGLPLVVSVGETTPYSLINRSSPVTVSSGEIVTVNGEQVTVNETEQSSVLKEVIYLSIVDTSPNITFTFGSFSEASLYDWGGVASGVNYPAYIVTGSITGGEADKKKQVPYLNVFFKRTEEGFNEDLTPRNPSSCILSSQWNWTDNTLSGKWSTPRQAYRLGRLYFPEGDSDEYLHGETLVSTRNKIRGMGHSVAFRFEAEEGKNLHIYGWSFTLQANEKE